MDAKHVANISALIHFMEGLHTVNFDMGRFTNECNTPSCALGWACTMPELQKQGLDIKRLGGVDFDLWAPYTMSATVFGCENHMDLFAARLGRNIKTPQQWANHARALLKSKGHEVTQKTEAQSLDFQNFMERVLKPVAVEAQRA